MGKISPSPSSSLHSPHTSYKMTPRVIVVGGGLSGLSAAHTIYLAGGNVVVLDKQGFFGGNSTKATSGTGSKQAQQSQTSAGPVMSKNGDSSDPGKVSKPNKPAEFKIPEKEYSMEEVAKHNKKEDLWVVVKGVVMDVSDWLDEHPGGPQAIMNFMGRDATEEFEMLHDDEVIRKYAPSQVIGRVKGQKVTLEA